MLNPSHEQSIQEIWQLFRESRKEREESRKEMEKLREHVEATTKSINQLDGMFRTHWGRMIEALVKPSALKLFQERGIEVHYLYQRAKSERNGQTMEVDLILENQDIVIMVEVKSRLTMEDVQDTLDDLVAFTEFFPKYNDRQIYGAVAAVQLDENAARYAYRRGLFVVGLAGEGLVEIKNDTKFRPKDFRQNVI